MTKYLLLTSLISLMVTAYLASRRSEMQKIKPKRDERMSHRWRVETAYDRDGDAA